MHGIPKVQIRGYHSPVHLVQVLELLGCIPEVRTLAHLAALQQPISDTKTQAVNDMYLAKSALWHTNLPSLVPRPSWKAERGSGVLSNISCHMVRGLCHKEYHNYTSHPGLELSDDLGSCMVWFKKA